MDKPKNFKVKNDIMTAKDFSEWCAFIFLDEPINRQIRLKMDLELLDFNGIKKQKKRRNFLRFFRPKIQDWRDQDTLRKID